LKKERRYMELVSKSLPVHPIHHGFIYMTTVIKLLALMALVFYMTHSVYGSTDDKVCPLISKRS
jgi:hypothetical protein